MVGREVEMARLEACWREARNKKSQIVYITGEAGIGKSRLLRAMYDVAAADDGGWIECHGAPNSGSTPFHPLIEMLQRAVGLERSDAAAARVRKMEALLASLNMDAATHMPIMVELFSLADVAADDPDPALELSPGAWRERLFASICAYLGAVAAQQPTILAVENMHFLDASSVELLDFLSTEMKQLPLMLVVRQRADFSHSWPQDGAPIAAIALKRLDSDASAALVDHIAGDKNLANEIRAQIVVRTDGLPAFVEEATNSILVAGILHERKGPCEIKGAMPSNLIPETLKESLVARIDSLADAKKLTQIGAAIGRSFSYELLAAVSKMAAAPLGHYLAALNASGLIETSGAALEAIYSFKQALVQEAAYESLPQQDKQSLHERIAQALETDFPEIVAAEPELLAHHFTIAGRSGSAVGY